MPAEAAPVEEFDTLPPAAEEDVEVLDWLAEPAAAAPAAEPEPLADLGIEDEPMAAAAPAEAAPAEEFDELPPAAEEDVEVLDWLAEPAAAAPAAEPEPLADLGFGDEPPAAAAPVEEFDTLPPAAEEEAEVLDWLEEPAAAAPTAEPEPLADLGIEGEPLAGAMPAEAAPAEEFDALRPAAEEEAEVLDWLAEPAAAAPAAEPEPLADLGFGDEPPAAAAPVEEFDTLPPAAEEEAEVLDWLAEPAAAAPTVEPEPMADLGIEVEPMAAAMPAEAAPAEEFDAQPPAAEEDAEVLDWLAEPAAAAPASEPEPLADLGFDDMPIEAAASSEITPIEEPVAAKPSPKDLTNLSHRRPKPMTDFWTGSTSPKQVGRKQPPSPWATLNLARNRSPPIRSTKACHPKRMLPSRRRLRRPMPISRIGSRPPEAKACAERSGIAGKPELRREPDFPPSRCPIWAKPKSRSQPNPSRKKPIRSHCQQPRLMPILRTGSAPQTR